MATVKFGIPDKEQSILLRKMGIDPEQYAVIMASEHALHLQHHKTRHEASIYIREGGEGISLNEDQISLLRSIGVEPRGYTITLDGKRILRFTHNSSGNKLSIYPNRRVTDDNQREGTT